MLFEAVRALDLQTVTAIASSQPNLSIRPFGCFTPLHFACALGDVAIVDALLKYANVDANVRDAGGNTPFLIACSEGHLDVVKRMVKDRRVDVNLPDPNNASPLWWAAFWGHEKVVQQLIACGRHLDLDLQKERSLFSGTTIKQIASKRGKNVVFDLLDEYTTDSVNARRKAREQLGCPETDIERALGVWLSDVAELNNREVRLIDSSLMSVPKNLGILSSLSLLLFFLLRQRQQ
jgi:ankyrin repeat protein